ncbi:MAG: ABC-F family ATP-binding cassette domain-containing protein [Bacilli bacterium]|nr:ABC-F family ATP-binding cassette domain-containing protein [Bacilli bacterium]
MIEISLNNIKKSFGFKNILDGLNIEIKTGDRVSIIGENGCGKTTVLNIINSIENIDSGTIAIRRGAKIGYLNQQPENIYNNEKVKDILYNSFKELLDIEKQLKRYEDKMTKEPENISIINKYIDIQEKFINLGGYEINTMIDKVSSGMNISHLLNKNYDTLSGGEQKRVVLAAIIVKNPDILLLDEPTNHLDINTIEWLEEYLNKYNGTVVVVSHDRYFLDKVTNKTILIENGKSIIFHCNYSKYLIENEERIEKEFKEYKDQQKLILALKKKIKQLEEFGRLAYPGGEPFYKRAENIRKRLEKLEKVDKPIIKKELPINFDIEKRSGNDVLTIVDYNLSIGDNVLINNINLNIIYKDKICIIGNNGCGKSSLLKMIINNSSDNIKVGSNVKIGYIPQQINFKEDITILDYARKYFNGEESHLRSALHKFQFYGENVFKKVTTLSGGEKVRLMLFTLIHDNCNFIILDEPTNHIDISTKETLEDALINYEGTILFVSHDRYFINKLANKVLYISDKNIIEYCGNYDYFMQHKK